MTENRWIAVAHTASKGPTPERLASNATVRLPDGGLPLTDEAGNTLGRVESVRVVDGQLVLGGTFAGESYSLAPAAAPESKVQAEPGQYVARYMENYVKRELRFDNPADAAEFLEQGSQDNTLAPEGVFYAADGTPVALNWRELLDEEVTP